MPQGFCFNVGVTKEFDIRLAVVDELLAAGIDQKNIRIQIPLDTNSSEGRADIVLLLDGKIFCIELKSGSDKAEKDVLNRQIEPYRRAFDGVGVIVDERQRKDYTLTRSQCSLPFS